MHAMMPAVAVIMQRSRNLATYETSYEDHVTTTSCYLDYSQDFESFLQVEILHTALYTRSGMRRTNCRSHGVMSEMPTSSQKDTQLCTIALLDRSSQQRHFVHAAEFIIFGRGSKKFCFFHHNYHHHQHHHGTTTKLT